MIFRTWAMVLFAPLSLGVIFRARQEERLLAKEFEEEWEFYCQEVNSWIPGFRKRVK
jgi:protein-S-isoprenylcysteine O-methyltransferase Ste14